VATTVHISAPEGYIVGPLKYPIPDRFAQAEDEVAYGYSGSVLLMTEIRPPQGGAMLAARAVTVDTKASFTAEVSFLCCDKLCVQGKAQCQLELPVGGDVDAANQALFAEWKARLPVPLGSAGAPATGTVSAQTAANGLAVSVVLNWAAVPVEVRFFPAPEEALKLSGISVKTAKNQTQVRFNAGVFKGQTLTATKLTMVVAAKDAAGGWRGVQVDCPIDSLLSK
jgi:DsbC/DsbD-like thiol-disulfide interchange protein